jgi:hypothetical protein
MPRLATEAANPDYGLVCSSYPKQRMMLMRGEGRVVWVAQMKLVRWGLQQDPTLLLTDCESYDLYRSPQGSVYPT